MTDRNATAMWLDAECRKGLIKRLTHRLRASSMLRRETEDEIEDHVSRAIEAWIRRDAFAAAVTDGKPPSTSQLTAWAVRIALNTIRDRGTDAHSREMFGARTVTERTTGLQRCVHAAPDHSEIKVCHGDDEGSDDAFAMEIVSLSQKDAEGVLLDGDVRRSVEAALRQQSPRSEDAADRLTRVWDLMVGDATVDVISDTLGVSPLRAVHLTNRVRERLRKAQDTVCEALQILRDAEAAPIDAARAGGHSDALRGLTSRGYLRVRGNGSYTITVAGRERLSVSNRDGWMSRLVL